MAEEPSWEDIFNPNPTPPQPAAADPVPLVEPPQAYPPTRAFPALQPEEQQAAAPAAPVEQPRATVQPDPLAGLFGSAQPAAASAPPAAAVPLTAQPERAEFDPFAELFGSPSTEPAQVQAAQARAAEPQPAEAQSVQAQPAFAAPADAVQQDPFATLFATPEPAAPAPAATSVPPVFPEPAAATQQYPVSPLEASPAYPAAQPPLEPTQSYPGTQLRPEPTQSYPSALSAPLVPEQQGFPLARPLPPLYEDLPAQAAAPVAAPTPAAAPAPADPFAVSTPAAGPAPTPDDPFAGLFGSAAGTPIADQPVNEYTLEKPFPTTATARFTPREEDDPFAALFGASASAAPELAARETGAAPAAATSRREARNTMDTGLVRGSGDGSSGRGSGGGGGGRGSGDGSDKPRKKRRLLWLKITLPIVLVLALVGGAAGYGWFNYNEQVRALLGIPLPTDYTGNGNGKEVVVTVRSGDIGEDIAHTLHDKGVTLTFDAFYDLLVAQKEQPAFQPGNFKLQEHMSAKAALKALLDPNNKVTDKLLITEGTTLPDALQTIADTTGISLDDLKAASQDLAALGVPTTENGLEGWLFPATYTLDGGQTAHDVLQLLVNTMIEHLDAAKVPADQRHNVLTLASIIQREGGSTTDFGKVARVFQNRLDQNINLESDATVAYGTGNLNTVWTTDDERADANNPYNTYVHPGLPVGPIGLPGDDAINAALHPEDGPWLFFVPVNLQTGETVFSETADEHEAAVEKLHEWCDASPENDSYCQ